MNYWKILNLWINRSYGFNNWSYIKYKIWKETKIWSERETIAEDFCIRHWIRNEDDMYKLENRKIEILDEEISEDWTISYLVRLINKKINPERRTFWLNDY